ncbi:hypothetical protein [Actinophytocola sp.]|jgi:hypothetical protein|uniref:hypothetical protein n=1 Tax=Actinophytocola sp. TaxID=1872138 RepID=UPI002EDA1DD4
MTHENPVPPPPPGYDADADAFANFTRGYRPLADQLSTDPLAAHTSLHGDAFSRVGNEVGLSDAIRNATQRQVDRVKGLATNTTDMATAVESTWTNYVDTEDSHDRAFRRAAGDAT